MTTELIGALYTRTSHEKDDAFSIASQVKLGLSSASANNIRVPEQYIFKEDFTGTVIDRPELNKVRRLMAERRIDVLIIYDIDRLARKKYISEYLLEEEIFGNSVQLFVARKNMFVRNTFGDRVLFGIEGNSAQDEREKIIERTARGRREKLEGNEDTPGAWLGQSPVDILGYQKVGRKRETRLVVVEEEAAIIRLIFKLFVEERWPTMKIVRYLDAQNIPTPSQAKGGKAPNTRSTWHHAMIYRILKNTAYTGVFYGFRTIQINGKTKRRPKEEWIRLDFPELQLVDQEVFDKAQELLAVGRSMNAPKWSHEYLLARILRCHCGYAVLARASTKHYHYGTREYTYYACYGKSVHVVDDCPIPRIRSDVLDAKVWQSLEALLKDPDVQLRGLKRAQELQRQENQESIESLASIEQKRAQFLRELDELYQDYKDKVIRKEIYLKRKEPLEERLRAIEEVQREYQEKISREVLSDEEITEISEQLRQLHEVLEEVGMLAYQHKRNLIELMQVTGQFRVEGDEVVLILKIHNWDFERLKLGVVQHKA